LLLNFYNGKLEYKRLEKNYLEKKQQDAQNIEPQQKKDIL